MAYRKNSLMDVIFKEIGKSPRGKRVFNLIVDTVGKENLPALLRFLSNSTGAHPSSFMNFLSAKN